MISICCLAHLDDCRCAHGPKSSYLRSSCGHLFAEPCVQNIETSDVLCWVCGTTAAKNILQRVFFTFRRHENHSELDKQCAADGVVADCQAHVQRLNALERLLWRVVDNSAREDAIRSHMLMVGQQIADIIRGIKARQKADADREKLLTDLESEIKCRLESYARLSEALDPRFSAISN